MQNSYKRILICFVGCFTMFFSVLYAQDTYNKFEFASIKEGISKVGIYTIIQDDLGFIWLGTNGVGLYRYDGLNYDSFKYNLDDSTSLSSNIVFTSCRDSKDRLWFGTTDGLNLFHPHNERFTKIANSEFGVSDHEKIIVRSLKDDGNGNLFVGTMGFGLFILHTDDLSVQRVPNQQPVASENRNIKAIQIDSSGKVFVGTNSGIREYDRNKNILKPSVFPTLSGSQTLTTDIESLEIDSQQNIWVGTVSDGLYKIKSSNTSPDRIEHFPISRNLILSLKALPDGTVLCGAENEGLFHLAHSGRILHHYTANKLDKGSILSNSIWSMYLDEEERIWLGHFNKGVSFYDPLSDKFNGLESLFHSSNSLNYESVAAIAEDSAGRLWIGMDGGGIDVYDKEKKQYLHIHTKSNAHYSGLTSDYIEALLFDSHQNLWVGSWDNGIYFLKKGSKHFIHYNVESTQGDLSSNSILSIAEGADGMIWIGTFKHGLHSYDPAKEKFQRYMSAPFLEQGIPDTEIRDICIDDRGRIWLATSGCLFKVERSEVGSYAVVSMWSRLSEVFDKHTNANNILSLYPGKDEVLWIGTRGAGLCKYDLRQDVFTSYQKADGLNQENINSIVADDDGNLWLAGNSGITRFEVTDNKFTPYTVHDGLLSNDFNVNAGYKDREGIIYFGNFMGIDYFNPASIILNKNQTSLHLKGLKLFHETVLPNQNESPLKRVLSQTNRITLTSKQSVFTIEYLGLNYTRPEGVEYAYYLKGYEDSWNYVGNKRSATYTNLDAGDYTFMLKASNNDGVWSESPLTLDITVLPPWYMTFWAFVGYVILLMVGLFLFRRYVKDRIKHKQQIAHERIKRLQEKQLQEKKSQFFTNISHEFRTPLTLIMNPLWDVINDENLVLPDSVKEKHKIIYKNADRLSRLINEILDFRKLELNKVRIKARELDLIAFCLEVSRYFKEEAASRNIDLSIHADVSSLSVWVDESMMEKILFNLLSNAFKVTPDGGTIRMALQKNDELVRLPLVDEKKSVHAVQIVVSDTGSGMQKEELKKIFERYYQIKETNKVYSGGTGIGLDLVQSFIHLHKGRIEVDSEPGKGTNFKILLPQGNGHFSEENLVRTYDGSQNKASRGVIENNKSQVSSDDQSDKKSDTIAHTLLIVEDNAELRNYLKEELKTQYRILTAVNGAEGLEAAKESLPDIILTDVIMPEMDGLVFCKSIKKDMRTSHIPLLMLTAKTSIENRMEGIETGADAYMVKPFDMRLLKIRLSQLIKSRQIIFNKYFSVISDVDKDVQTTSLDKEFIERVLNYIHENMDDPDLNVEALASRLNLSRSQFYRKIKALTNQTASEFLRNIRLQRARQLIESGNDNISEVCYKVGFSSPSYFTKCFKNYFGLLPTEVN